jgi:hypothetical protein
MAGDVVNIKVCSPLKLYSGLTGNYHAICHYSYNLPLGARLKNERHCKIDGFFCFAFPQIKENANAHCTH